MPPAGPIQAPARGLQEQACVLQTCTACNGATMRQNCDPDETIRSFVLDSTFHPCAEQPDPWEACRLIVEIIRQNSVNALICGKFAYTKSSGNGEIICGKLGNMWQMGDISNLPKCGKLAGISHISFKRRYFD